MLSVYFLILLLGLIFNPATSDEDYLGATKFMVGDPADSAMVAEAMKKSHGRHAPEIIPDGPVSRLVVLEILAP